MNKLNGGSQSKMWDSKIMDSTCLDPLTIQINWKSVRYSIWLFMTFCTEDDEPFWMTKDERIENKDDSELDEEHAKKYTHKQLNE